MDIDLLSKMIRELVLEHDRVTLPGLGVFIAEMVPASFTDKGYTITPPYRRLSFRPGHDDDGLLVSMYASVNAVSPEVASAAVSDFVSGMKEVLEKKKVIVFPGLGRMRATRENNFFFVSDEDLDIYPAGFGLEPVSLKTHDETREELSTALDGLSGIIGIQEEDRHPGETAEVPAEEVHVVEDELPHPEIPADMEPGQPEECGTEGDMTDEDDDGQMDELKDMPLLVSSGAEQVSMQGPVPGIEPEINVGAETVPAADGPDSVQGIEQESGLEAGSGKEHEAVPESASEKGTSTGTVTGHDTVATTVPESKMLENEVDTRNKIIRIVIAVAAAAVLLLLLYVAIARIFPGVMDGLLYNDEDYEILHNISQFKN